MSHNNCFEIVRQDSISSEYAFFFLLLGLAAASILIIQLLRIVRGFGEKLIRELNDISTKKTYPKVTILLDVPVEIGLSRRGRTDKMDRLDLEKKDFHEKVRAGYLKLAKENKAKRWVIVDASKSMEEVSEEVVKKLKEKGVL